MERKSVKSLIVIGRNLCEGQIKYGLHEGNSKKFDFNDEELSSNAPLQIMDFESESEKKLEKSDVNIFLPYDVTIASQYKGAVDFRYKIGELTPYAPSFLCKFDHRHSVLTTCVRFNFPPSYFHRF